MEDFPHLRIVEVLVKCCCPWIPSNIAAGTATIERGRGKEREGGGERGEGGREGEGREGGGREGGREGRGREGGARGGGERERASWNSE